MAYKFENRYSVTAYGGFNTNGSNGGVGIYAPKFYNIHTLSVNFCGEDCAAAIRTGYFETGYLSELILAGGYIELDHSLITPSDVRVNGTALVSPKLPQATPLSIG